MKITANQGKSRKIRGSYGRPWEHENDAITEIGALGCLFGLWVPSFCCYLHTLCSSFFFEFPFLGAMSLLCGKSVKFE